MCNKVNGMSGVGKRYVFSIFSFDFDYHHFFRLIFIVL